MSSPGPAADPLSETEEHAPEGMSWGDGAQFLGALLGVLLVGITPNPPVTVLDWVQIIAGAVLTAAVTTGAVRERMRRSGTWAAEVLRDRWGLVLTTVLLAALVAVAVPLLWDTGRGVWYRVHGCPAPVQLRVLAEPETFPTARELADRYALWSAGENHGCPTAEPFTFSAEPATIARKVATAKGWSDAVESLRAVGPRPDVWLAASRHEVDTLPPADGAGSAVVDAVPVAHSPLVLAVPVGVPRPTGTWLASFRQVTGAGTPVLRPDPRSTQAGLLATALLYGRGDSAVGAPARVAVERTLDAARGNAPNGDAAELLCPRRAGTLPPVAVVATEQDVARYNQGAALGAVCGPLPEGPPPERRLEAAYPTDTADQDLQLVRLRWTDPAPQQEREAEAFGRWLRSAPGRAALGDSGLRPADGLPAPGDPLTAGNGVDPSAAPSTEPVPPGRWADAYRDHETAQLPSRLLFLVDTSGSMLADVAGRTRAAVVADAVGAGLADLRERDEFGVWFFPGGTRDGHTDTVPVRIRTDAQLGRARAELAGTRPAGETPLFRAVVDGVTAVAAAGGAGAEEAIGTRAVVVLTDGRDTASGIPPQEAVEDVVGRGVRVVVVALGDVRCAEAGLSTLADVTGGVCTDADAAAVPERVRQIVTELRGGQQ